MGGKKKAKAAAAKAPEASFMSIRQAAQQVQDILWNSLPGVDLSRHQDFQAALLASPEFNYYEKVVLNHIYKTAVKARQIRNSGCDLALLARHTEWLLNQIEAMTSRDLAWNDWVSEVLRALHKASDAAGAYGPAWLPADDTLEETEEQYTLRSTSMAVAELDRMGLVVRRKGLFRASPVRWPALEDQELWVSDSDDDDEGEQGTGELAGIAAVTAAGVAAEDAREAAAAAREALQSIIADEMPTDDDDEDEGDDKYETLDDMVENDEEVKAAEAASNAAIARGDVYAAQVADRQLYEAQQRAAAAQGVPAGAPQQDSNRFKAKGYLGPSPAAAAAAAGVRGGAAAAPPAAPAARPAPPAPPLTHDHFPTLHHAMTAPSGFASSPSLPVQPPPPPPRHTLSGSGQQQQPQPAQAATVNHRPVSASADGRVAGQQLLNMLQRGQQPMQQQRQATAPAQAQQQPTNARQQTNQQRAAPTPPPPPPPPRTNTPSHAPPPAAPAPAAPPSQQAPAPANAPPAAQTGNNTSNSNASNPKSAGPPADWQPTFAEPTARDVVQEDARRLNWTRLACPSGIVRSPNEIQTLAVQVRCMYEAAVLRRGRTGIRASTTDLIRTDPELSLYHKLVMCRNWKMLSGHIHCRRDPVTHVAVLADMGQWALGRSQADLEAEYEQVRAAQQWLQEHVWHLVLEDDSVVSSSAGAGTQDNLAAAQRLSEGCTMILRALGAANGSGLSEKQIKLQLMAEDLVWAGEQGGAAALLERCVCHMVADRLVYKQAVVGGAHGPAGRFVLSLYRGTSIDHLARCDPQLYNILRNTTTRFNARHAGGGGGR